MRNRYLSLTTKYQQVFTCYFRERAECAGCKKIKRMYNLYYTGESWMKEPIHAKYCMRCLSHYAKTGEFLEY